MKRKLSALILAAVMLVLSLTSCLDGVFTPFIENEKSYLLDEVPAFNGKNAYVKINNNKPFFEEDEITDKAFESYSELDALGRARSAVASIGIELMPDADRESIGQVKPSGWHTVKYEIVEGKYLYNRCHLIGFQLTGENANPENLITGTRFLNIEGMLDFENIVADYIQATKNHVMYRVTPIYSGNNLLASGVLIEAYSVEDKGAGIEFCVYSYNAQPGIYIDYSNGESRLSGEKPDTGEGGTQENEESYVLNTSTMKFHRPSCSSVGKISESNRKDFKGQRSALIDEGYSACGLCRP